MRPSPRMNSTTLLSCLGGRPWKMVRSLHCKMHHIIETTPQRSEPFALLIPTTDTANNVLKIRQNRSRCQGSRQHAKLLGLPRKRLVARLDFGVLLGRRHISFGSSRAVEVRLPRVSGISSCHFLLHFEQGSAKLKLTDKSASGTWVFDHGLGEHVLVHCRSIQLNTDTSLSIGANREFAFDVVLTELMKDVTKFAVLHQEYRRNVDSSGRAKCSRPSIGGCSSAQTAAALCRDKSVALPATG